MRAVIYCRVSTEEEIQISALKSQVQEAITAVGKQKWNLVDQYIDEGKSGTTTNRRDEYNRLVSDLELDKFDIIVVKSQDRLMRNTKEWYIFVDKLVQAHKKLFFYLDNKYYTADDALITGIRAILAEEYSRDLSKKINNAHRNRQEKGSGVVITSNTWGYDKINKEIVINEKEAEIVRYIFCLCCEGYGSRKIAKYLESKGIKSRTGNKFPEITVRRIIRNPLFMGTVVMNKRHMDFNTKRTTFNDKSDWIFHEGIVPAIVSEDVWKRANEMMDRRALVEKTDNFKKRQRGKNIGIHHLSGKIKCGECGSVYWLRFRKNAKDEQIKEWSCSEYVSRGRKTPSNRSKSFERQGGCDNIHVKDGDLEELLFKVGQKVFGQNDSELLQETLEKVIESAIGNDTKDIDSLRRAREAVMKKREMLLDKMLENIISEELFRMKDNILKEEYDKISIEITDVEQDAKDKQLNIKRIEDIMQEVKDINDRALVLSKLSEHITEIRIYQEHGVVSLDFLEEVKFNIRRINYRKVEYTL